MKSVDEILLEIEERRKQLSWEMKELTNQNTPFAGMLIGQFDGLGNLAEWIIDLE